MSLQIRPALEFERAAAEEVSRRAFEPLRAIYRPTAAHQAYEREHPAELEQVVAVLDGRVVGSVRLRRDQDYLFVIGLAVDPEFRRQAVARRMLDWLARAAGETGRGLALATIRQTGNVEIFRRLGFEVVLEEPAAWCESDQFNTLHDVYMVRPA